jgi:RNA recognition motif-containing protein
VPHPSPFDDGSKGVEGMRNATEKITSSDAATSCQHEYNDAVQESEKYQSKSSANHSALLCDTISLFVGGLHPRIGDLHLQKLFSPYGEIVRIHIVTNNPSESQSHSIHSKASVPTKYKVGLQQSKGYAFVEYTKVESAQLAIARLDGRQLMGRTLAVRPSRRKTNNQDGVGSGANLGKIRTAVTAEEARREYKAVQSKIEAVKRAIDQKKHGL